jgi:hypothetical protein
MTNEQLRMQMLAGVITEGEYRAIINKEIIEEDKTSLNESMIGGIVGIGAINQIPPRAKADYEMAFEHFLGERYQVKPNRERDDIIEEGLFGDLLSRMEKNTRLTSDILTIINLAKEDKEGNAEKAIQLMMDNHGMDEEGATEAVTRIFKKAFEWVDSNELNEEEGANGGENPIDAIMMDVPLFIRMLEYAREDASTDMDLHDVAEKAIAMSAEGGVLSMDNYEDLVGGGAEAEA